MNSTSDLPPQTAQEPQALSVSAAMQLAKGALEHVVVKLVGEVSELSNKPGYKAVYFTVKDESASLPCMMWDNRFKASGVDMHIGSLVEITGRFTLYAAKGRMNFDVFSIELAGEGDLRMKVARLAKQLEAEGLTSPERKKSLPFLPQTIGLVTSPRGAAVHDVLRTLRRRYPAARVLLAGVPVEGSDAPQAIIEGMRAVYRGGAEIILIVRGGGSFEDLMPFNDEALARAIAACPTPIVTGIGHEPDTSIADMVADLRASTPTAAAEAISPATSELITMLEAQKRSMGSLLDRSLGQLSMRVASVATRPLFQAPEQLFAQEAQGLDYAAERLHRALPAMLDKQRADIALRAHRLHDLSPLTILGRGYALARDEQGHVVKSINQAPEASRIELTVSDGTLRCLVESSEASQAI